MAAFADVGTCAYNHSIPCPLPNWTATWDLAQSTAIGLKNSSGFYDPAHAAKWGLVSFDWGNARGQWSKQTPFACEESMVEQCRLVKAINPHTKCLVYRNTELALQWMASERSVMDREHAGFFLQFQDSNMQNAKAKCDAAGTCNHTHGFCCPFGNVYCENPNQNIGTGWRGEQQYFWDFRNTSLQKWWVENFLNGPTGVDNKWVDGVFTDDVTGLPEEHDTAIARMGYTAAEMSDLHAATGQVWQRSMQKLVAGGGYNWQLFGNGDYSAPPPHKDNCTLRMRELCVPEMRGRSMMMSALGGDLHSNSSVPLNITLAAFLIARPAYGYIGYSILEPRPYGCPRIILDGDTEVPDCWNSLFDMDVGEPLGVCEEAGDGEFSRKWTKGTVSLSCNSFTSDLPFNLKSK